MVNDQIWKHSQKQTFESLSKSRFERFCKYKILWMTSCQDIEIKKKKVNFYVTLLLYFFVFVIHLITMGITTTISMMSSSMSVFLEQKCIWCLWRVWWWRVTFLLKIILDLIIFYFNFHLKEYSQMKWILAFLEITKNIYYLFIYLFIYLLSQGHTSRTKNHTSRKERII